MRAGPARHRFELKKEERTPDGAGGSDVTWVKVRDVWAHMTLPSGRLAAVAERIEAQVTAELLIRPTPEACAGRRLVRSGVTYEIQAALPDNTNSLLRLLCSTVANP
ncbi:phage head closure protein [Pseudomonas sp. LJDD11]|uniref:phage head closure protein n=1 Tax=Pseudomonas sp. LJDD11 TaxID=2931984 RepID=UPI00211C1838|nr:phage head closure protein [Pseudomonas sp. LJDD11]MCQ9422717.1 phage head closure protein [Pseudomonas sp. LJDD11]